MRPVGARPTAVAVKRISRSATPAEGGAELALVDATRSGHVQIAAQEHRAPARAVTSVGVTGSRRSRSRRSRFSPASFPLRALRFAQEWGELRRGELERNRTAARAHAPLVSIDPLP